MITYGLDSIILFGKFRLKFRPVCNSLVTLSQLCALDLRLEHFPIGMVQQSSIAKVPAIIVRCGEGCFEVLVARDVAVYVWECLERVL